MSSEQGADAARQEDAVARQLGITGVPFFVFGGNGCGVAAQEAKALVQAYEQAASAVTTG